MTDYWIKILQYSNGWPGISLSKIPVYCAFLLNVGEVLYIPVSS